MPKTLSWADALASQISRLRTEGASCDSIAAILLTCWTGIERGRRVKALRPPRDFVPPPQNSAHDPLPVGHARSWGVINARIVLEGAPYPLSIFPR
jgi:hypothetical protein